MSTKLRPTDSDSQAVQKATPANMPEVSKKIPYNLSQNEWSLNLITIAMGGALFFCVVAMVFGVEPTRLKTYVPAAIGFAIFLHRNNDGVQRPLVSFAVLVVIVANSVYILRQDYPIDPILWITNKLLYVFALPFFLSQAIENRVRTDRTQSIIMAVAGCVWFGAFVVAYNSWSAPVECSHVENLLCTPDVAKRAFYSASNMWEDLGLGALAIFLTAAYKMTQTREELENNDSKDSC